MPPEGGIGQFDRVSVGLFVKFRRLAGLCPSAWALHSFMSHILERALSLIHAESDQLFHARNPFAVGGVYEDPATGAAAAALAGYLRDINWPHGGCIDIVQGEDMGMKSLLRAEFSDIAGSSVRVSGAARVM